MSEQDNLETDETIKVRAFDTFKVLVETQIETPDTLETPYTIVVPEVRVCRKLWIQNYYMDQLNERIEIEKGAFGTIY